MIEIIGFYFGIVAKCFGVMASFMLNDYVNYLTFLVVIVMISCFVKLFLDGKKMESYQRRSLELQLGYKLDNPPKHNRRGKHEKRR